jgi:hypothetical protein
MIIVASEPSIAARPLCNVVQRLIRICFFEPCPAVKHIWTTPFENTWPPKELGGGAFVGMPSVTEPRGEGAKSKAVADVDEELPQTTMEMEKWLNHVMLTRRRNLEVERSLGATRHSRHFITTLCALLSAHSFFGFHLRALPYNQVKHQASICAIPTLRSVSDSLAHVPEKFLCGSRIGAHCWCCWCCWCCCFQRRGRGRSCSWGSESDE